MASYSGFARFGNLSKEFLRAGGKFLQKYLSLIAWIGLVCWFVRTMDSNRRWQDNRIISNDVISYYAYLPALFVHHDLKLEFVKKDREFYLTNCMFWPEDLPNGELLIKTTMGMSLFYSPFFFIAEMQAEKMGEATDGFSAPYHWWICMGCLLYSIIGLWFLRLLLRRYFSEIAVATTMLLVALGSNYFYYATEETMLTHNVSFMLIAAFAYYTSKWHEEHRWKHAFAIGLVGGLIILVRPNNITIAMYFLLYGWVSLGNIRQQFIGLWSHRWQIIAMIGIAVLVFFPQLLYWKYVAGHWFTNPYTTERFYFAHPHILDGLLSYRKGWLLYSPVMIFSVVGLWFIYRNYRKYFLALLVFLLIHLYIIFSWWDWWYGGSFGARAMVDISPLLCLPFAAFFQWLFRLKSYRLIGVPIMALAIFTVVFFQVANFQYRHGMLHWVSMTRESYWYLFLKTDFSESDVQHLQTLFKLPDYDKAKRGEEEYPPRQ